MHSHLRCEDTSIALNSGLTREIEDRLGGQLQILNESKHDVLSAIEVNEKFAAYPELFDAAYGDLKEFFGGITDQVGLPAKNLMEGMVGTSTATVQTCTKTSRRRTTMALRPLLPQNSSS
jgi:hypothetical protein